MSPKEELPGEGPRWKQRAVQKRGELLADKPRARDGALASAQREWREEQRNVGDHAVEFREQNESEIKRYWLSVGLLLQSIYKCAHLYLFVVRPDSMIENFTGEGV